MFSSEEQAALTAVERLRRVEAELANPSSEYQPTWLKEEQAKAREREGNAIAKGENPYYHGP